MDDIINFNEIEHGQHGYTEPCYNCFTENRQIKEFKANEERMNGEQGEGRDIHLENEEALEPRDGGTPWDRGRPD